MNNSLGRFHRHLHRWYSTQGRKSLPWRHTRDPYAIYVSEIMLQQTQVKTVLERYYAPFLTRFPTLSALAKAPRKDVLKAWEGLGYYNRAINLHEAAKRSGGTLPKTVEELLALPGIGHNTAHAIAAFAYKTPVPVLEANVKRVMARIHAQKTPSDAELWQFADALLDRKNPFDYNQAMMDLGALICTKRAPKCKICPANALCKGKNTPESYPAGKVRKIQPIRRKHIVVLHAEGKYFAKPRSGKFLQGLYQFVEIPLSPPPLRGRVREGGVSKNSIMKFSELPHPLAPSLKGRGNIFLGHIRQTYSHFTLEATVSLANVRNASGKHWHTLTELQKLPFSAAEQKILKLLLTETIVSELGRELGQEVRDPEMESAHNSKRRCC